MRVYPRPDPLSLVLILSVPRKRSLPSWFLKQNVFSPVHALRFALPCYEFSAGKGL